MNPSLSKQEYAELNLHLLQYTLEHKQIVLLFNIKLTVTDVANSEETMIQIKLLCVISFPHSQMTRSSEMIFTLLIQNNFCHIMFVMWVLQIVKKKEFDFLEEKDWLAQEDI